MLSAGLAGSRSDRPIEKIYEQRCASCHGVNFEGGLGGSFIDGEWKYGARDEDLARNISEGQIELGMTPWKGILTPEEIRAMVIYLREQEARARSTQPAVPQAIGNHIVETRHVNYRVEPVAEGLELPWAIAFLPDGGKLVTERPGRLRLISAAGALHPEPIVGTPVVAHHGQGGLMEVALHPDYARNGWIYLGLAEGRAEERDKKPCLTAVFRGRIKNHCWVDEEVIYRADETFYSNSGAHFGTRFVFDQGFIFFVIGERGGWKEAQDLSRPNGKIFRLHDDGRVPADNPFVSTAGALPGIWSYGHRNPQGLDRDPATGALYCSEHGPRGGDELNRVRKGLNYGWPVITYGMNYDGMPITAETTKEGMEQPVIHWTPSIAPCGLDFYRGDAFAAWQGDLFAGSLKFEEVRRLRLEKYRVVEQEVVLKGLGRVRDVAGGPDGFIYVLLNKPGRILRMVPAE